MPTEALFDIEAFLQPIDGDSPAGTDIREDYSPTSPYFEIKDGQAAARTAERRRRESFDESMDTSFSLDDWRPIEESAQSILKDTSKDLEIACWHIEALLRSSGFAGIRDGFKLLQGLVDRFWDGVFPRPDEDGLETTVAAIASLNGEDGPGTLIWPISNIPLFSGKDFGAWQVRQAQSLEGAESDVIQERVSEGYISPEMLRSAVQETSPDFFRNLLQDIEEATDVVSACDDLIYEKSGNDEAAPSLRNITEALNEAASALRSVTEGIALDPVPEPEPAPAEGEESAEHAVATTQPGAAPAVAAGTPILASTAGIIQTRDQAFRAIQELADHFKKTEPHSPVPYLLNQAVRWGRMPLPQLLNELLYDQNIKDDLFRVMGLGSGDQANDDGT